MPVLRARRRRSLSVGVVWLPGSALAQMRAQARRHKPLEHGGMLLGWESDGQLVVSQLVDAGPKMKATRSSFAPDGDWQQRQLEGIYADSGRTVTYLGDWHSHPRGSRRPSGRDQQTATMIAAVEESRTPEPVSIILRKGTRGWQPYGYRQREGRLQPLSIAMYPGPTTRDAA
jgi:integrative and conjugative element protein (TIGR02256 family)